MHIVTVEKFLCCFKLETGGNVLGWLGSIFSVLAIIGLAALGALAVISYDVIEQTLNQSYKNETMNDWIVELVMNSSRVCS